MSARRHTAGRSRVREWQIVTVQCSASSSAATGLPTRSERPTTTASAPTNSTSWRRRSSITPDGVAALQFITVPDARYEELRKGVDFIQKHIFPGGLIPSAEAILEITQRQTGLRTVDMLSMRQHHAETLRLWRERFMQRRKTLAHAGFGEVFARMWELYLAHAEAGFRSGYLNVCQWSFVSEALP